MLESKALGFWAKHCWTMDQFYEEEELPGELAAIRNNEENQALLNEVIAAAERDVEWLLQAIQTDIESELARKGSPFKVSRKRSDSEWTVRMDLEPRRGVLPRGPIQLGVQVVTTRGNNLHICVWLWTKGGRATERAFNQALHEVAEGSSDTHGGWGTGVSLICNEPIDGEAFRGSDGLAVDLQKLRHWVLVRLQHQSNDRLHALVRALQN